MAETTTVYGVARGEKIIGNLFSDLDTARRHLAAIEDQIRAVALEPDVRLVTVEVTTTHGRPHVYKEPTAPEPEDPTDAVVDTVTTGPTE